jgi:transposase
MRKVMEQEVKVTQAMINKVVNDEGMSKSSKMKALFDLGLEVKEIANILGVRYNFVYNVISNYCSMNGIKVETNKRESKRDQIIELHKQGLSNKEISIELKTNYNYVFNVIKAYKRAQEMEKESKAE